MFSMKVPRSAVTLAALEQLMATAFLDGSSAAPDSRYASMSAIQAAYVASLTAMAESLVPHFLEPVRETSLAFADEMQFTEKGLSNHARAETLHVCNFIWQGWQDACYELPGAARLQRIEHAARYVVTQADYGPQIELLFPPVLAALLALPLLALPEDALAYPPGCGWWDV